MDRDFLGLQIYGILATILRGRHPTQITQLRRSCRPFVPAYGPIDAGRPTHGACLQVLPTQNGTRECSKPVQGSGDCRIGVLCEDGSAGDVFGKVDLLAHVIGRQRMKADEDIPSCLGGAVCGHQR